MVTTKKKLVTIIACVAFAVALALPATAALANNHADSWYAQSGYTAPREKTDFTSSWNQCVSGGSHTATITSGSHVWVSPTYSFHAGQSGYMLNNVKENGYNSACLYTGAYATGWWSPDSI